MKRRNFIASIIAAGIAAIIPKAERSNRKILLLENKNESGSYFRSGRYISWKDLKADDVFCLYEHDGKYLGMYIAHDKAYRDKNGMLSVLTDPYDRALLTAVCSV